MSERTEVRVVRDEAMLIFGQEDLRLLTTSLFGHRTERHVDAIRVVRLSGDQDGVDVQVIGRTPSNGIYQWAWHDRGETGEAIHSAGSDDEVLAFIRELAPEALEHEQQAAQ